jgi:hypothetical protein
VVAFVSANRQIAPMIATDLPAPRILHLALG